MDRLLFANGVRGPAIEKIQAALEFPDAEIDGYFGPDTEAALRRHQKKRNEPTTGTLTLSGWGSLTGEPPPSLFERVLSLTAAFEGHGFSLAQGNFDGAGITWGIIGFTLASGSLGEIIAKVRQDHPRALTDAFRANEPKLLAVLGAPKAEQLAWASSISIGAHRVRLAEPWRSAFHCLGALPEIRAAQIELARSKYFEPALKTARKLALASELGIALCFDIHVQNGGIKARTAQLIKRLRRHEHERALRERIALAVADSSLAAWRDNVKARKLAIARGSGIVHGELFTLRHWGLDELAA
jgi:hypothetical protein